MKKLKQNQEGFITLIVALFLVLVAVLGLVFWRVSKANQ